MRRWGLVWLCCCYAAAREHALPWSSDGEWSTDNGGSSRCAVLPPRARLTNNFASPRRAAKHGVKSDQRCGCDYARGGDFWQPREGDGYVAAPFRRKELRRTCALFGAQRFLFIGDSLVQQIFAQVAQAVQSVCRGIEFKGEYKRCWDPSPVPLRRKTICDGCNRGKCTFPQVVESAAASRAKGPTTFVVSFGAHVTGRARMDLTEEYAAALKQLRALVSQAGSGDAAVVEAVRRLEALAASERVVDQGRNSTTRGLERDLTAAATAIQNVITKAAPRGAKWSVLLVDAPPGHPGCVGTKRPHNPLLSKEISNSSSKTASPPAAGRRRPDQKTQQRGGGKASPWATFVDEQYHYIWHGIPVVNAMAARAFSNVFRNSTTANYAHVAAYDALLRAADAHLGSLGIGVNGRDCLHYCTDGPLRVYPELIRGALGVLDAAKNNGRPTSPRRG